MIEEGRVRRLKREVYAEEERERAHSESAPDRGCEAMSLERAITLLKDRADSSECNGECDQEKPYVKCDGCEAARVLNEINVIIRMAL